MQHQGIRVNTDREPDNSLASLGERIQKARSRERDSRPRPSASGMGSLAALTWRMFADLLAGVLVGFGLGWGVDFLLGTTPWFLIGIGLLGIAAGIRLAMRTFKEANGEGGRG